MVTTEVPQYYVIRTLPVLSTVCMVMIRTNAFPYKHIIDYVSRDVSVCGTFPRTRYPTSYFNKKIIYLHLKFQASLE